MLYLSIPGIIGVLLVIIAIKSMYMNYTRRKFLMDTGIVLICTSIVLMLGLLTIRVQEDEGRNNVIQAVTEGLHVSPSR